jgi:uncharacterized protein YjbI with pentapeptide repeats
LSDLTVLGATRTQSLLEAGFLLQSTAPSPLTFFNQTGLTPSGVNTVLDTITISAQAREALNTGVSPFDDRLQGLVQLGEGNFDSFIGRDYSGAIFFGQNLDGALFENAILQDVNFAATSLRGATFITSLVEGAQFGQADLTGADLRGAQGLTFAQVQNATFDDSTLFPDGIGTDILSSLPFGSGGRV